jgi:hypothetical protein
MGNGVIVEAGDVPELEGEIDAGLAVGSEEDAVFSGVLVGAQGEVKSLVDGGYGSGDAEVEAVGRGGDDGEAVFLGEGDDGVVVVLRGCEGGGELSTVRK